MRKIRIFEHISLDGVIEHDGDYEYGAWTAPYRSPGGAAALLDSYGINFDLLLGRTTYDLWSAYWPTAGNFPMAKAINAATKYVATHHPDSLQWGPYGKLGEDVIAGIRDLKATDGPDLIIWGSSTITSVLLAGGLVDDVVLVTYPVLLGRGRRLFSEEYDARELEYVSTISTPAGLQVNHYKYVGALKS
ncbi:dihydrofolate reductase family protein [Mucilaginibacter glaciei]|uniref:Dihydrofolate reductase family protein n=1 Tax=Mucilaginibacter glaciei TaxID=2772109 RepID=A0A926S0R3_9SPHI|nr:dihydrofolate reductase family protein [Mucilaginibacter glaciei]MBD1392007.1 dihydrofolate reductase family protein [Mucilaginibacter glaciei]